jgi:hypothetical protein
MKTVLVSLAALAAVAGSTLASETIALPNTIPSISAAANANALDAGDATFVAAGGYQLTRLRLNLSVTEINGTTGDFVSENRLRLWVPGSAVASVASFTLTPGGSGYTGTVNATATVYLPLNATFDPAGSWSYRFFHTLDDAPLTQDDAEVTNASLDFNFSVVAPSATNLGNIAGPALNFNTEGSVITSGNDTEIGVFGADGRFLGTDDDSGTGNLSSLNLASLPDGIYYIAVAGYNAAFADGFTATTNSTATGNVVVNVTNGTDTLTGGGALASRQIQWYTINVPTPGALAILGMGALIGGRRRAR